MINTNYANHVNNAISLYFISKLPNWRPNTQCAQIQGTTDGTSFGPFITSDNRTLRFFNPDSCRTLNLNFERQTYVRGIYTWRYRFAPTLFSTKPKENRCYCLTRSCTDGASVISSVISQNLLTYSFILAIDLL